jgi:sulfate-transporting ATPase
MNDVVQFALLGLGPGAIYALLGQGIIVIYRGSGIVNFGHGALAMVAAFVFVELHEHRGWSFMAAFVFAVLLVSLLGVLLHMAVLRSLRRSSPLTRLIATLGLLSALTGAAGLRFGTAYHSVGSSLPQRSWHIGALGLDVSVGSDRMYLFLIALVLTAVLYGLYRFTRFGLGVSAAAENEQVASALGWSPNLLASVNWAIGSALAATAGILVVPITGLQIYTLTLLVIAALAAALVGGFVSFPLTLLGGALIGAGESLLGFYGVKLFGVSGQQGVAQSLPFFAIVVILVVRGRGLPLRSHLLERLPALGSGAFRPRIVLPITLLLAVGTMTFFDGDVIQAVLAMALAGIIILSLVALTGYAGQVSLAQYALAGIGALFAGRLVSSESWPFEVAFLAGIAAAMLIGLVFAMPALRTRGINLAVITLGLGVAVQQIVFQNGEYTGGLDGTPLPSTRVFGLSIDPVAHQDRYAVFCLAWFVVVCFVVSNLRRGRAGRRLIAIRSNERAAASLGVSVYAAKLYAFALSGAIAGLGGVLIGFQYRSIVYESFNPLASINSLLQAVLGGIGYVVGAVVGSGFAPASIGEVLIRDVVSDPGQWLVTGSGVVVLALLLLHPDGAASMMAAGAAARRRSRRAEVASTDPTGSARSMVALEGISVRPATLEVRDLALRIGAIDILRGVDLTVHPGEIVGLIGPNGAGKTMLVDSVTGFVRPTGGSVLLDGEAIDHWTAARRARAGLARSFQSLELFDDVTVRENLLTASDSRDAAAYLTAIIRLERDVLRPAVLAAIAEFALGPDLDRLPRELPYGRRRLVAIARAIATQPSVLLLDEPAAGLSEVETAELASLVRGLAANWGIGILLIEHDMSVVMGICDRIVVLDFGEKIADGRPDDVRRNERVVAAYLGATTPDPATIREAATVDGVEREA